MQAMAVDMAGMQLKLKLSRPGVHRLCLASVVGQDSAQLMDEQHRLEGEAALVREQLAEVEIRFRKAMAFKLPEREKLELEMKELQQQLDVLEEKLGAVKAQIPAPSPESVFIVPPVAPLPPLDSAAEAEMQTALRQLDACLQTAIDAEVAGKSPESRAVVDAEAKALELLESELSSCLRGFGTAEQRVAKRQYTLQEMKDNGVDAALLLSPKDTTLDRVRSVLLSIAAFGGAAAIVGLHLNPAVVLVLVFTTTLAVFADQVSNGGFIELLVLDTLGRVFSPDYPKRVVQHEAGHFLVAYLEGVLPKSYTLSALDAFHTYKAANTQAGCVFCDTAIQQEVQSGKLSSKTLDKFVCIALGGVVVEYLLFGQAEGGLSDIQQLEGLFQSLKFDQQKTNAQMRWAVLNTVGLLKQHAGTHRVLAEAMMRGASVGECISLIEQSMASPGEFEVA